MIRHRLAQVLRIAAVPCLVATATAFVARVPDPKQGAGLPLEMAQSSLFAGSGNCEFCHTSDGEVLRDKEGNDLSPPQDWRSTMMANSFTDPYFQATLEREVALRPGRKAEIEDSCLTCHAPMARTQAIHDGATSFSLAQAEVSPLARDGVSCTLCHQIQPDNLGTPESWNGGYEITDERVIFGPYATEDIYQFAMQSALNYTPQYGAHKTQSEVCATCHTLFTPIVDDLGTILGQFPEQTPYLEWKNSVFSQPASIQSCQDCHMPITTDPVVISSFPPGVEHTPFYKHYFVGGNAFMLSLLKNNIDGLGLTASEEQFDRTIERTLDQLRTRTVNVSVAELDADDGKARVAVRLENLAGHKFPTGYPARRAWLKFVARDAGGNVLFESGAWNPDGEIVGLSDPFEPHHDLIANPADVQVYEPIIADLGGAVTTSLMGAASYLKDNRLPPRGYLSTGSHAASTAIIGDAATDPNFNRDAAVEGTGADVVTYEFDISAADGAVTVEATLVYQSVAPRFVAPFRDTAMPKAVSFLAMYDAEENAPATVGHVSHLLGAPGDASWMIF